LDDDHREAFEPGNDRGVEAVETVADAIAVGVGAEFVKRQFEQRHRLDLRGGDNALSTEINRDLSKPRQSLATLTTR
jgi:hypothetical protein